MYSLQLIVKSESVEDLKKEIVRVLNVLNNTEDVPDIPGMPGNPNPPKPASVDHKTSAVSTFKDLDEEDIPEQIQPTPHMEQVIITSKDPTKPVTLAMRSTDLDSEGLPWDGRIHSASKTFNKDGTWRIRRGVDVALINKVKEEIKSEGKVTQVNVPPVPQVPSVPTLTPVQPVTPSVAVENTNQHVVTYPVTTPVAPVVEQPKVYEDIKVPQSTKPAHSFQTFKANIVPLMAQFMNEKKIDQAYIEALKAHFQVKEVFEIFFDDTKMTQLFEGFVEHGYITKVD